MTFPIVLLTNPIDDLISSQLAQRLEVRLASSPDPEILKRESVDASFIIVRAPLPADLFGRATRLRGVVRHGAGLDMIPVDVASRHGVAVANVPAVNAKSVAEYAIGQMVALARQLPRIDTEVRRSSWTGARELADCGEELHGKTVAIVGMGAVGQALARICALGFGMHVLGVRRTQQADTEIVRHTALDDALPQADYLGSMPSDERTRGLIGAPQLALIKTGARLINVCGGPWSMRTH